MDNNHFDSMYKDNYGIGDARPTKLYRKRIYDIDLAQGLADLVCETVLNVEPVAVAITGQNTKRVGGVAKHRTRQIVLHHNSYGVLAHELAHYSEQAKQDSKHGVHHGYWFKKAHEEVLELMEAEPSKEPIDFSDLGPELNFDE